jgi:hypothetical protein
VLELSWGASIADDIDKACKVTVKYNAHKANTVSIYTSVPLVYKSTFTQLEALKSYSILCLKPDRVFGLTAMYTPAVNKSVIKQITNTSSKNQSHHPSHPGPIIKMAPDRNDPSALGDQH